MASAEVESLWTRLRRRKVVQWGIAYAAGAWGLLQGLAYVIETFRWPELLQPLVTLGLLIGLPIVLVLAWYHGDRGEQRVTATEFAIITLLFLVGGAMCRPQHVQIESLLVSEVVVHRSNVCPGPTAYLPHSGAVIAMLGENLARRRQQAFSGKVPILHA